MADRGRRRPSRPGLASRLAIAAVACWAIGGCLGPAAVRSSRMRYNEAIRVTNDEQLLLNLVRLRYADTPIFIDLPSITSQFELAAGGSDPGPSGSQTNFGIAGLSGRDSPTLSYHPRQGREIAKALLNPLSADVYSAVTAGASLEQLLWMTLNDINDVQNAIRATTLAPRNPDDPGPRWPAVRLDGRHRRPLRRRLAAASAAGRRDGRPVSRLLVLHPRRRRGVPLDAGGPGDLLLAPGVGRGDGRSGAHPNRRPVNHCPT
jgi:hypothetical protein